MTELKRYVKFKETHIIYITKFLNTKLTLNYYLIFDCLLCEKLYSNLSVNKLAYILFLSFRQFYYLFRNLFNNFSLKNIEQYIKSASSGRFSKKYKEK